MQKPQLTVKNDVQKYGVELLDFYSPNFDTELVKSVADKDLVSAVREASPLAVILMNRSDHEIVGVSLRWHLEMSDGEITDFPQGQINPGIFMGLRSHNSTIARITSFILPGESNVFCFNPLLQRELSNIRAENKAGKFNPNTPRGSGGGVMSLSADQKRSAIAFQSSRSLHNLVRASVSIDGIFFDDGTFVGPNENFTFESVNGELQAKADFSVEVRKGQWVGKSDDSILNGYDEGEVRSAKELLQPRARTPQMAYESNYAQQARLLRRQFLMLRAKYGDSYLLNRYQKDESKLTSLRKL
jgi:hypothetical protein